MRVLTCKGKENRNTETCEESLVFNKPHFMWSGDAELNTRFSEFAAVGIHLLFGIEMLDHCSASVTGLAA